MLNILFSFWQTMFSFWGDVFRFVCSCISGAISAVTHGLSWIAARVTYWPLMLFTDGSAEGIFTWWPLFCICWGGLLLLVIVILALTVYCKRKQ